MLEIYAIKKKYNKNIKIKKKSFKNYDMKKFSEKNISLYKIPYTKKNNNKKSLLYIKKLISYD